MIYFATHSIHFVSGDKTAPYRLTGSWKTVRGALRAAEAHAKSMDTIYREGSIAVHAIVITDQNGAFVTNLAA